MSKIKRHLPFWGEFLLFLLPTLSMLAQVIYEITNELLFLILMGAMVVPSATGMLWVAIKKYRVRIEKRGILGLFLLIFSNLLIDWVWVMLCITLLGGGLVLYDIASKRDISQTLNGESVNG